MSNLATLYKTGSRGLESWIVTVEDRGDFSEIIVDWGLENGKRQKKITKIIEGKNIGKSNETTHNQQALSEAESKFNKQKDKGYSESKKADKKVLPMLAKVYGDHKKKVKFPVYVQPKLNGLRSIVNGIDRQMTSRKGKPQNTVDHLKSDLDKVFQKYPDIYLDGELYKHGQNFETIISAVKRDEVNDDSGSIDYCVYDCFYTDKSPNYSERLKILEDINKLSFSFLKIVPTYICNSEKEIFEKHSEFLLSGYEGTIIRLDGPYEIDKRSFNLLKFKDWQDSEFKIVGANEDKNGHCKFDCVTKEGYPFEVTPKGSHEYRVSLWKNHKKYIGKEITVKYFSFTNTEKPVPLFPIGLAIRDYE